MQVLNRLTTTGGSNGRLPYDKAESNSEDWRGIAEINSASP